MNFVPPNFGSSHFRTNDLARNLVEFNKVKQQTNSMLRTVTIALIAKVHAMTIESDTLAELMANETIEPDTQAESSVDEERLAAMKKLANL